MDTIHGTDVTSAIDSPRASKLELRVKGPFSEGHRRCLDRVWEGRRPFPSPNRLPLPFSNAWDDPKARSLEEVLIASRSAFCTLIKRP